MVILPLKCLLDVLFKHGHLQLKKQCNRINVYPEELNPKNVFFMKWPNFLGLSLENKTVLLNLSLKNLIFLLILVSST